MTPVSPSGPCWPLGPGNEAPGSPGWPLIPLAPGKPSGPGGPGISMPLKNKVLRLHDRLLATNKQGSGDTEETFTLYYQNRNPY